MSMKIILNLFLHLRYTKEYTFWRKHYVLIPKATVTKMIDILGMKAVV